MATAMAMAMATAMVKDLKITMTLQNMKFN